VILATTSFDVKQSWYNHLRELAKVNLSTAHLEQHRMSATNAMGLAGNAVTGIGTYSVNKKIDTVVFSEGVLTGTKYWVSNLHQSKYAVLLVNDNNRIIVVCVDLGHLTITQELTPTVGMEQTVTGQLTFNHTPATFLFSKSDDRMFQIGSIHAHAFCVIQLGVIEGVFNDIESSIPAYEQQKLRLNISVLNLLLTIDAWDQPHEIFWRQYNTIYAFAKNVQIELLQTINQFSSSSMFVKGSAKHQRYMDLLIYTTHMKNASISSQENMF
jgi:hypothetical protein